MNNLLTVDISIFLYIKDKIKPIVNFNLQLMVVPVIFANQLRWNMIKTNNYLINSLGKIQCPVIAIKRTALNLSDYLKNKKLFIDNNQIIYSKPLQKPRIRDIINGKVNKQLYTLSNTPTFMDVLYLIIYWTNYISHKNKILLCFLLHNSMYWNGHNVVINGTSLLIINLISLLRIIKSTITIKAFCKILTDHDLTNKKVYGILKIIFELQIIS